MALTGALQADFSEFVAEANKASAALGVMDAEAKKTGATLAKTGAEVDGVGKKTSGLTDLSKGLRLVDQSANAMGVSLSKPIAAIEEISQVSGKSAKELGALGTAGAVAGAALAGWQVGRWIAEITGADKAIANLTARLIGWGDVGAQEAAAKADVFRLALERTGYAGTDLNEAMRLNYEWVKRGTAAVDTATHRQALWEQAIRKNRDVLPEISAALENHTGTVAQLAKQYKISEDAIEYYVQKTKTQTAAQDEATRKAEAAAAAQQKLKDAMFGGDSITKANEMTAALGGVGNVSRMTTEEQAKLNTAVGEAIETYKRWGDTAPAALNEIYNKTVSIGTITTGLGSEWANVGTKFTPTADAIVADIKRMSDETAAYEAETQAMAQAWQQVPPPVDQATAATERLSVAMSSAVHQTDSLFEKLQAGKALFESYQAAGVATGSQIGLDPYNFKNQQKTLLPTMSSTGNSLNVTVNSTEAGDISKKIVDEMRRQGVRF
jgi:hypothetical protein